MKIKYQLTARAGTQSLSDSFFFRFLAKRTAKKLIEICGFDSVEIKKGDKIIRAHRSFAGKILWL